MTEQKTKITVLGAGISGLAAAHWLNREEDCDVTVLEAESEPGGSMISRREGGYLIDYGPNSGLETTPLIQRITGEIGLAGEMIYANEVGNNRYILKHGQLQPLPMGPGSFITTRLFSLKAKLRLVSEPFIGRSDDGYYQSVSAFVRRRLGQEFLDYAINPFVSGVFAGNPDNLSVKSAFPKLYRLEEVYGGLIKGMIKGAGERKEREEQSKQNARMFSFRQGMQAFPRAIAERLADRVQYACEVQRITPFQNGFQIKYLRSGEPTEMKTDVVLSAVPAYRAANVFVDLDETLARHLREIYYPPVKTLYLGYQKKAVGRDLNGFGFLIPEKEKKSFLGAIWSSTLFACRAADDQVSFTLYVGGARSPGLLKKDPEQLNSRVIREFQEIMNIHEPALLVRERMWPRAIPQYNLGHIEHERYIEAFEAAHPGIFLSGNFCGGISVGDCISHSATVHEKVISFVRSGRT